MSVDDKQVSVERTIEEEIARLEYLYTKDVLRALDSNRDDGEVVSALVREWERRRVVPGPIGSEPWLLDHETVCPVTNLTYHKDRPCPHHFGRESCG